MENFIEHVKGLRSTKSEGDSKPVEIPYFFQLEGFKRDVADRVRVV